MLEETKDVVFMWVGRSVVDDGYEKIVQEFDEHLDMAQKVYFSLQQRCSRTMADPDVFCINKTN